MHKHAPILNLKFNSISKSLPEILCQTKKHKATMSLRVRDIDYSFRTNQRYTGYGFSLAPVYNAPRGKIYSKIGALCVI